MTDYWFPWYPALYRLKTLHLTAEQDGIYRRLIDHYMESAQPLPDNISSISRIAGVQSDSDAIRIVLAYFTHESGVGYRHHTCDSVLADMYERHVRRHGAAKAAADARWKKIHKKQDEKCESHAKSNADAMRKNATLTPTYTNKGKKKESINIDKPDSVSESVWHDFLTLRKNKNAPVTKTVIDGILREAGRAGVSLELALTECCVRGWQSFKADWYKKSEQTQHRADHMKGVMV